MPEHENINMSETPTNHQHWSVGDSSPADARIFDENKMFEAEKCKVCSWLSRLFLPTQFYFQRHFFDLFKSLLTSPDAH